MAESMAESRRLLWRYYAYRITNATGFYVPISILYLQHEGFGLAFIGLVQAVDVFAIVAAEIPAGYLGDRLGRRASLAIGSSCRAIAMGAYPFVDAPMAFVALNAIWGTGWAFRSGTKDAWLYEVLKAHFDESEYARIEGRGSTALLATSAVTAIAGGALYSLDAGLPFLANGALAALGLPVLFSFPSVENGGDAASGDEAGVFTAREAVQMLCLQAGRPEVRWLVAYAALFSGLFGVTRVLEQPALSEVGLPVVGLGVLYAGFKLISAGAAASVGWLQDRLGTRGVFVLLAPLVAIGYASVALSPWLLVGVIVLYRSLKAVTRPVRNQYLNDRLGDVGRATVLSGASMVLSLATVAANLVGGRIAEAMGPIRFLPWAGVTVAVAGGLLWLTISPVRPADETESATVENPASLD